MTDIVERLRNVSIVEWCEPLCAEAAAEIERLRELLREGVQYPSGEPPLWRKRVREALGDE